MCCYLMRSMCVLPYAPLTIDLLDSLCQPLHQHTGCTQPNGSSATSCCSSVNALYSSSATGPVMHHACAMLHGMVANTSSAIPDSPGVPYCRRAPRCVRLPTGLTTTAVPVVKTSSASMASSALTGTSCTS